MVVSKAVIPRDMRVLVMQVIKGAIPMIIYLVVRCQGGSI